MVSKVSGKNILNILVLVGLILLSVAFVYQINTKERTAFINMKEVFGKFEYKKEMESRYNKVFLAKKTLLDSLKLKIEFLSTREPKTEIEGKDLKNKLDELKQEYMYKQSKFEEENSTVINKYNQEIWEQLNQYIKDFGTENNYDYVFGTNGEGNLMYAKETKDITKQVLDYVNAKYQGNAKTK